MRRLLPVICLLLAIAVSSTHAENLYRCIAANGAVSYQSQACSGIQRLDRIVEYRADPAQPHDTSPRMQTGSSREKVRKTAQRTRSYAVRSTGVTANSRCRASKAAREAALQRLGLSRTYEQLGRLDAPVRAACRGF